MCKFIGSLFLFVGLAFSTNAQQLSLHADYDIVVGQAFRLAQQNLAQTGRAKGTNTQMRLIMQAGFLMSDDQDTAWLKYGGARSSVFNYMNMRYYIYALDRDAGFNDYGGFCNYDSMWFCNPSNRGVKKFFDCFRTFGTDNKVHQYMYGRSHAYLYPGSFWYTYNSQGDLSGTIRADYDTLTAHFDTTYRETYLYDNSNRCIGVNTEVKTAGVWVPAIYQTRTYNAGGLLEDVLINFLNSANYSHFIFYYDNAQRLSSIFTLNNFENTRDSLSYDSNNSIIARDRYSFTGSSSAGTLAYVERRHLNVYGQPDSVSISQAPSSWGAWDSVYSIYTYDSYGDPTRQICYVRGTMQIRSDTRWFYEPTSVSSSAVRVVSDNTDLGLFPNPAKDHLQLKSHYLNLTNGYHYLLTNIAGQTLMAGTIPEGSALPISALTPGRYLLNVTDKEGRTGAALFVKE